MPKNRDKQRHRKKEDKLSTYNEMGFKDPTPYEAVLHIKEYDFKKVLK